MSAVETQPPAIRMAMLADEIARRRNAIDGLVARAPARGLPDEGVLRLRALVRREEQNSLMLEGQIAIIDRKLEAAGELAQRELLEQEVEGLRRDLDRKRNDLKGTRQNLAEHDRANAIDHMRDNEVEYAIARARGEIVELEAELAELVRSSDEERAAWAAEEAQAKAVRAEALRLERDELLEQRDLAFRKIEKALKVLDYTSEQAQLVDLSLERIDQELGIHHSPAKKLIRDRLTYRLRHLGLDKAVTGSGAEPLVQGPAVRRAPGAQPSDSAPAQHPNGEPQSAEPVAQSCSVCRSEKRGDVDAALGGGEAVRSLARRFEFSRSALQRHKRHVSRTAPA